MTDIEERIINWAHLLEFPADLEHELLILAEECARKETVDSLTIEERLEDGDARRNLGYCLAACEDLAYQYAEKGIPNDILLDTMRDIWVWTENYRMANGCLGLGELCWLKEHLAMRLFKIGRLQFQFNRLQHSYDGLEKGEPVLAVHIPRGGSLTPAACQLSYEKAIEFFTRYFPSFSFSCFTCDSWLLDGTLSSFMKENSNIICFQREYVSLNRRESFDALDYLFGRRNWPQDLSDVELHTSLQKAVAEFVVADGKLYTVYGVRRKCL